MEEKKIYIPDDKFETLEQRFRFLEEKTGKLISSIELEKDELGWYIIIPDN